MVQKCMQDGSKMVSRWFQDDAKMFKDGSQMFPRWFQMVQRYFMKRWFKNDITKMAQKWFKEGSKMVQRWF